jgi:NAD+ kinase
LRPCNEALQDINFAMNEISVSRKDTTWWSIDTYLNGEFLNSIGLMV